MFCYNTKEVQKLNTPYLELVCGMARIRKATQEPWLHLYKRRHHNAKTIPCQTERSQAVEITFNTFWRFAGEMARKTQNALTRDCTAVIATLLNWATMQHQICTRTNE